MPRIWDYPWAVTGFRYPRAPGPVRVRVQLFAEKSGLFFFFSGWKGAQPVFLPSVLYSKTNRRGKPRQSIIVSKTLRCSPQRRRGGLDHGQEPIRSRWYVVALAAW